MSRMPTRLPRFLMIVAVPLVAVAGGVLWWLSGGRYISTENAFVSSVLVMTAGTPF